MLDAIYMPTIISFLMSNEVTFFTVICFRYFRFFGCHRLLTVAIYKQPILRLNPLSLNILKKVCSQFFQWKNTFHYIMLTMCFSRRSFARFPWHFWKLDIYIFVHFRGAMPFLFDDYIREIYLIKDIKNEGSPFVGYTMIPTQLYPTHVSVYYNKTPFFGGFSMILLSRFSLFLKIIVKSKWKCSV